MKKRISLTGGSVFKKNTVSLVFLILSALILIGTGTFAWLSANRRVDTNELTMEVNVTSNLVIADTEPNLKAITAVSAAAPHTTATAVTTTTQDKFYPASHSGSAAAASASNLIYSTDPTQILKNTGLPASGAATTATVPLNSDSPYYVDYVVWIGSHGKYLNGTTLTATLTSSNTGTLTDVEKATSVDFYVDGAYADSVNLAGLALSNDSTYSGTAKTSASLGTVDIPLNTETGICVTMRCYFDGALLKSAGQTFVTTESVGVETETGFSVAFEATGGTESDTAPTP